MILTSNSSIFITGSTGMVGSLLEDELRHRGCKNIITIDSRDLDLRDQFPVISPETIDCDISV